MRRHIPIAAAEEHNDDANGGLIASHRASDAKTGS